MKLTINGQIVNAVLGAARLEKSREDASAIFSATLWTAAADTFFQKLSIAVGDVVRLTDDNGAERFLGSIHALERQPEQIRLTAFDRGVYLARNELYGVFCGSGADICRQVAGKLGIAVGEMDADSARKAIVTGAGESAFSVLRKAAGQQREISVEGEKLTVRRCRQEVLRIPDGQLLSVSATADIRKLVDRCVVVDRKGRPVASAEHSGDIAAYGLFQQVLGQSGDAHAQAKAALKGRAMTAGVTLWGDLRFQVGSQVDFHLPQWGLEGRYAVTAVSHRWEAGIFTTELTMEVWE